MIEDFINQGDCLCFAHCPTCRTDAAWRKEIGAPDVCPWVELKKKLGIVDGVTVNVRSAINKRLDACLVCQDFTCPIKPLSNCMRRKELSDPRFVCQASQF